MSNGSNSVAIVGTVGVPANYGGFETLVENLLHYHQAKGLDSRLTVYCSGKIYQDKPPSYLGAQLEYVPLSANGAQSIAYDVICLLKAVRRSAGTILLLGVSGAIILPLIRLISRARIVTNIDGIEWRRDKWSRAAKWFLKLSERFSVRFSHVVIADNQAIADYVKAEYGKDCQVIAYGGDHAVEAPQTSVAELSLPRDYAFGVCRIEPENNVALIVGAFAKQHTLPLVMVGNWNASEYGRSIRNKYAHAEHLYLLDPIYDLGKLNTLRANTVLYVHGHSAGGTNPSLVEAMHFGKPIAAFDCVFNRYTTEGLACFFCNAEDLAGLIGTSAEGQGRMLEVARRRYTWNGVAAEYFALLASA